MATNLQFIQQLSTDGKVTNFDLQNIFDKGYEQYNIFLIRLTERLSYFFTLLRYQIKVL